MKTKQDVLHYYNENKTRRITINQIKTQSIKDKRKGKKEKKNKERTQIEGRTQQNRIASDRS